RLSGEIGSRLAGAPGVTVRHYQDHWLATACRDQVIKYEVCVTLLRPAGFVLAGAMLQVQHGIADVGRGIVVRRRINQCVPPRARYLRVVPDLTDVPVGHILS